MFKKYLHILRRKLAKVWLDINLQLTVVGVTGSYGKTSAARTIAEVLSAKYSVNKTDLNLDTIYNLPITLLKTKLWNEVLVLEYGVDHIGEMDFHLSLVKPKIAVLTGIIPVHTDEEHMKSLENAIAEKRKLVEAIPEDGLAVFNYDDENCQKIGLEFKKRKIFYGLDKKADIWASKVKIALTGTEFVLHDDKEEIFIRTGLLGYPAVYNCLVAWVVGKEQGIKKDKITEKLAGLKPLEGRFSIEEGPLQTILVNDSRRSNVVSALIGLKSFAELPGRKVAVLGEMGEIGEKEEELHRLVGMQIARLPIDFIVGVGPLTKFIIEESSKNGFKKDHLFWAEDVQEAAEVLKGLLKKGDILYLKASLLRHLERIILLLEGKNIRCKEIVCHHYQSCATCPNLTKKSKMIFA